MSQSLIACYVTVPDQQTADRIARLLISRRLAACVNILTGVRSWYEWQGTVESAEELVLVCKTAAHRFTELRDAVAGAHPHEVPCITALPITDADEKFAGWVRDQVSAG